MGYFLLCHKGLYSNELSGRKDGERISVPGIYPITIDKTVSMTMLTKVGSEIFSNIHNGKKRQIVMLDRDLEKEWLRDDLNQIQEIQKYL